MKFDGENNGFELPRFFVESVFVIRHQTKIFKKICTLGLHVNVAISARNRIVDYLPKSMLKWPF